MATSASDPVVVSDLSFVPVTDWNRNFVAQRLREADRHEAEVSVGWHHDASRVFHDSIDASEECWCAVWKDEPVAVFGVCEGGRVWMMGTDTIATVPTKTVVIASRKWVTTLKERHKVLWNFVLRDNELHIRWLDAMGFDFLREVEGPGGSVFIEFSQE